MVVGMEKDMYEAAISGDVNYFSDGKEDLHQITPQGNNILHLAAEFKQINFFKDVRLDKRSPLFWAVNKMGDTPMHIAARVGCAEIVDFLIERAKELYVRKACDPERGTTCAESYKKILRKTNKEKHTALHVAARYGHGEVVNLLMKADPKLCSSDYSAKESPLFLATCKGFSNIACDILKEPSASFRGIRGVTALHAAVTHTYKGAEEIVNIMASKYSDRIKKADVLGWTPLHYAAFSGKLDAIRLLIQWDKFNTCYMLDNWGMSALHIAAYKGHIEVMKELMHCRPDTCECRNFKGQTILHVAVLGAQSHVVKFILEQPDQLTRLIDQEDKEGNTPLHLAVIHQNQEIKTMLMSLDCRSVDNTDIDKGFSLVFDSFLGEELEDIKIQTASALGNRENEDPNVLPYNKAKKYGEEGSDKLEITDRSHHGRSFGVPLFQKQILRDFKKFHLLPEKKDSVTLVKPNETNLLVATLIATVTFTAALSPPGGYGDDGQIILGNNTYFRWFNTFNYMSFALSLCVLLNENVGWLARLMPHFGSTAAILNFYLKKLLPFSPKRDSILKSFTLETLDNAIPFQTESFNEIALYGMILAFATGTQLTQAGSTEPKKSKSTDCWMNAYILASLLLTFGLCFRRSYVNFMNEIRKA